MEIYADFRQKVQVNPKNVIEKLIEEEIGWNNWIFEKDGNFYRGFVECAGCHSVDCEEEISQEKYDYVKALKLILKQL
jgi:hypothetical protein